MQKTASCGRRGMGVPCSANRRLTTKIVRVMRITSFLLLAFSLHISAKTMSQTITLSGKNLPLAKVFSAIEEQTGFGVVGKKELLISSKPVTFSVRDMPLASFLALIFEDQPIGYEINERTVFIKTKAVVEMVVPAPPLTGLVMDLDGTPLPGASVRVKGSKTGTMTNAEGRFTIKVDAGDILVISFVGYTEMMIMDGVLQTKGGELMKGETGFLMVKLARAHSRLDEVQVMAYGTTSMRMSTGNISTVKAEDIARQPVNNPLQALQGRVPGIFIEQATGMAGSAIKVRIQGQNSIGNGNEPLYVIDGVPFTASLLPSIGDGLQNGSPLSFINPSDIESMDVLKDADATAIYGSRAAGGAILITTKKGKAGKTKVDVNLRNGWANVTRKIDLLNTQQYLQIRKEGFSNDNVDINAAPYNTPLYAAYVVPDLKTWDQNAYTDWQKELIGGTASYRDVNATVSGGTARTNYLVGATWHKETTVFPTTDANTKTSVHFNVNSNSESQKFNMSLSGSYMLDNNRLPGIPDLTYQALTLPPNAPAIKNTDGSINWMPLDNGGSPISAYSMNPGALLLQRLTIKTNNLVTSGVLGYEVLPGLTIKSSFGYTMMQVKETKISPSTMFTPEDRPYYNRTSTFGNNTITSWIAEPQITYRKAIGNGVMDVLAGTTFQQESGDGLRLEAKGFNSDLVMEDIRSATLVKPFEDRGTTIYQYRYNALFGRLNYNHDDRYVLTLSVRRDGSSRFGPENRFHNFASAAGAWIFSNERFINEHISLLSFGKLKASYGTTGNDQIGNYEYYSLYFPTNANLAYQDASGLQAIRLPNPYLQWEETKKLSFGLDLGFLNDRLLLNVVHHRNRSSNQLLSQQLATSTGFGFIMTNLPATVQNTGWEIVVNTVNIRQKDFSWSSSFNITLPKNKLIAFPGIENSGYQDRLIVGEPLNVMRRYHLLGVDPQTGLYEYATKDGGVTSSPNYTNDRLVVLTNINNPVRYGGLQNSFQYKGLQLDVLFSFVQQKGEGYRYGRFIVGTIQNQPVSVLDAWHKPGDQATFQRYVSLRNYNNYVPATYLGGSDAVYEDASYIRLKNVSLSWNLPEKFTRKAALKNASIYAQGQNLLTFTKYSGFDPENRSTSFLPLLRVWTVGLRVTL